MALRPEREYKLISYLYYIKYAKSGENIAFYYIDLNLHRLMAKSRGSNQIQGSVSLDDEQSDDYTILNPSIYNYSTFKAFYDLVKKKLSEGYVYNLRNLIDSKVEKVIGKPVPVPCRAGEVRISIP